LYLTANAIQGHFERQLINAIYETLFVRVKGHKHCVGKAVFHCKSGAKYRGADKSLARTGRKQARKHVRDARDFDNVETRAFIKFFFPAKQGAERNSRHSDRNISLFPSWSG